ncbi:MAG: S8 family serine peptidase [Candidatus Bathyarchaeia archaeon]
MKKTAILTIFSLLFLFTSHPLTLFLGVEAGSLKAEDVDLPPRQLLTVEAVKGGGILEGCSEDEFRVILELDEAHMDSAVAGIAGMGCVVEGSYGNLVQARVTPHLLEDLLGNPHVLWVRRPATPVLYGFTSEGVEFIKADQVHSQGFLGGDVDVAVIDVGFDPSNPEIMDNVVEAKSFRIDGDIGGGGGEYEAHGTGCAEIVVDVAPKARLHLINFETDLEFLEAVDYAISKDVRIITTSIGFVDVGPYTGGSYISKAADEAAHHGILFVASAGNAALSHWKGAYRDDDGDGFHNYTPGDETNDIMLYSGEAVRIYLSWDDWPTSTHDYDLYLYDEGLNLVASSTNPQTGFQPPTESISFMAPSPGIYRIVIAKSGASGVSNLHLFCFSKELEHYVEEGSVTPPADAVGALAVGAVSIPDGSIEPYSSRGPTDDGRVKPDLVAPDGVSTSSYGSLAFYGTSASTPHVAGAAALLLSANRSLTLNELREILESTAADKGAPGRDNLYGMGLVDAYKALGEAHKTAVKVSLSIHAHPDGYQYPSEPPQELPVNVSASYVYDGVSISLIAPTPFQLQADMGSQASITVESIPPGYGWREWDDYGHGRTTSKTLKLTLNGDHVAIAYFTEVNDTGIIVNPPSPGGTALEVHAHPLDVRYPDEPSGELPLKISLEYTLNDTTHRSEAIIGPDPLRITLDQNSTATLSAIGVPDGYIWHGWEIPGGESTMDETIQIAVGDNGSVVVVAYLKPLTVGEAGFKVAAEPARLVYIPGQKLNFTIHVTPINGFDGEVLLIVEPPPGVEAEINPDRIRPPGTAVLTLTVGRGVGADLEVTVKAVFQGSAAEDKITLQAWRIPGYQPSSTILGLAAAVTIIVLRGLLSPRRLRRV